MAYCLVFAGGCALNGLPRIDPSGEQILIFPGETPPVAPAQPGFAVPQPQPAPVDPFTGVSPITAPPGNPTAPPVYEDQSQGLLDRVMNGPRLIGGPVAVDQFGRPVTPAQGPRDQVKLTPERVLAPVGSEVVLRAGVCRADGYLECNQRVEWGLGQQGVGHFVQLGDQGETDVLRWPWQRPNKIDNNFAIGYTTPFHTCLKRNTADPADDVQIRPGDAWISVTSPAEGTSYVTAFAPGVDDWAARKASAVIYWVDAQWSLPPSVTVAAGQPHTLTTTITRQTDGSPLAGWIVRYEVDGQDPARLGYEAGQSTEATTDAQGRASIEITPTDAGPGASTVNITIVRPANLGFGDGRPGGPQVKVGSGRTTVTWASDAPATGLPPIAPDTPEQPPVFEQPFDPGAGPISPEPVGKPNLVVQLRRDTPDPIRVGDRVQYTVTVLNTGDGVARNVVIVDQFDRGLTSPLDVRGTNQIANSGMQDLSPNESGQVSLVFDVLEAGLRTHAVTVSADGVSERYERASFTAEAIQPDPPQLNLRMIAPPRFNAGTTSVVEGPNSDIRGVIENTGLIDATNVVVRVEMDNTVQLDLAEPAQAGETGSMLPPNGYQWVLPRLAAGQRRTFRLGCTMQQPSPRACIRLFATADGGATLAEEACFEILAPVGPSPADGGGIGVPAPVAGPFSVELSSQANPAQVNRNSVLNLYVVNTSNLPQRNVVVEVAVPQAVQVDLAETQPPQVTLVQEGVLRFAPIAELAPGGRSAFLIPYRAITPGQHTLRARAYVPGSQQPPVVDEESLLINPR